LDFISICIHAREAHTPNHVNVNFGFAKIDINMIWHNTKLCLYILTNISKFKLNLTCVASYKILSEISFLAIINIFGVKKSLYT